MKQLGNLTIVCANRPEVLMQLHDKQVSVHVGEGPERTVFCTAWDNDDGINKIIYELNFGKYKN